EVRGRARPTRNQQHRRALSPAHPTIQSIATHEHRRSRSMTAAAEKKDKEAGKVDGRSWAEQYATYGHLGQAIDPWDHLAIADCMEQVLRANEEPTDEYIEGFMGGAQEFFEGVRDKI